MYFPIVLDDGYGVSEDGNGFPFQAFLESEGVHVVERIFRWSGRTYAESCGTGRDPSVDEVGGLKLHPGRSILRRQGLSYLQDVAS